jgi:cell division septal protein FtsQ
MGVNKRWGKSAWQWSNQPRPLGAARTLRRPSRRRRYLLGLLAVTVTYTLGFSPLFAIQEVAVEGNRVIATERVQESARRVMQQRRWLVLSQRHLFAFNPSALAAEIGDLRLQQLTVQRRPFGTITVHITEKQTAAVWQYHERRFALDSDGLIVAELTPDAPSVPDELQATNSQALADPKVGESVVTRETIEALQRLQKARPVGVRAFTLYDVAEASQGQITAYTDERWRIVVATKGDVELQMAKLATFIVEKDRTDKRWRETTDYVDVRFGSTRVYHR